MARSATQARITRRDMSKNAQANAEKADDAGSSGSNALLISNVVRASKLQVWFLSEHLLAASPV